MLELGELLTTLLGDRAAKARPSQAFFEDLRQLEHEPEHNADKIAQFRTEHIWKTREATRAFTDLAHTRVGWLTDRIVAFGPAADEIEKFQHISRMYWLRVAIASGWDKDDTDTKVEERWQEEYKARTELIGQVKLLADLPHPPRALLRWRWSRPRAGIVHRWTARTARLAGRGSP